jgi:WD40 repeat protein
MTWEPILTVRGYESSGIPSGFPAHQRILFLRDKEAHVYDLPSRKLISKIFWQGDSNRSATLSPDGKWVATSAFDQNINIWNADSGELAATFEMARDQFARILNFQPGGRFAVTVGKTGDPELWSTQPWRLVAQLPGSKSAVSNASFSPDGARILTIHNFDRVARIWDGRTGVLMSVLPEHPEPLNLGVFSPDGSLVATTSDPTVRVFEIANGRLQQILRGNSDPVTSVQFVKQGAQTQILTCQMTARYAFGIQQAVRNLLFSKAIRCHITTFLP